MYTLISVSDEEQESTTLPHFLILFRGGKRSHIFIMKNHHKTENAFGNSLSPAHLQCGERNRNKKPLSPKSMMMNS